MTITLSLCQICNLLGCSLTNVIWNYFNKVYVTSMSLVFIYVFYSFHGDLYSLYSFVIFLFVCFSLTLKFIVLKKEVLLGLRIKNFTYGIESFRSLQSVELHFMLRFSLL